MTRCKRIAERLKREYEQSYGLGLRPFIPLSAWDRIATLVVRMLDASHPGPPPVDAVAPVGPNGPVRVEHRP